MILDTKNIKSLVGKRIRWSADGYEPNNPHGGVAIIRQVSEGDKDKYGVVRHTINCETISGDDLDYAIVAPWGIVEDNGRLIFSRTPCVYCYTDLYREIYVTEVEDE